nr:response regulator [Desulfobulbaceae bacterium]
MPSIALFCGKFTNEEETLEQLRSLLAFEVVTDEDIISEACNRKLAERNKMEQAVYKKTSVFNQFNFERERNVAHLKSLLAERLAKKQNVIYAGFISLLIPHDVTHVLKVLVVDSKESRSRRAVASGLSESEAAKQIRAADQSAYGWTDFLFQKEAFEQSLYDIVIPTEEKSVAEIGAIIQKNCNSTAVLENEASLQAVNDFAITAQVEHALAVKGQKVEVKTRNGRVCLKVNKSAFSFSKLAEKISEIASSVHGVEGVEVQQGKGYRTSIYRDLQFELPPKVLLVDDEKEFVQTLSERLVTRNVGSYAVFDGQQALDFIDDDAPDVMVLDLKMPGISGIEVLKKTKKTNSDIEVIILTGHGSDADRKTCISMGAFAYLQKPIDVETLSATIREAHKKRIEAKESG